MKKHFLIPCYIENFRCIGSLCEDTCCSGWKVPLDKKTYKNYKKFFSKNLKISLDKHIFLNKESTQASNYGFIKMNEDGACPYLSEEKLCKIQLELGEECLSYTCYSYPRIVNKINGIYEMSGSVSCPEVARLVLLNEDPMEFKDVSLTAARNYSVTITLENTDDFNENTDCMYYFWPLRIFTISTLQDRRYNLEERLILLGLVYNKIMQLSADKQLNKTLNIIESYNNLFNDTDKIKDILSARQENEGLFFSEEFIKQLDSIKGEHIYTAANYLELLKNIIDALGIKKNDFSAIEQKYNMSFERYYTPYINEKEFILENYLVNEVFKEFYPLARTESIDSSYKMLLTLYNVIRFHLVGIATYYEKLDDTIAVNTIQAFSKAVLHHKNYLNIFQVE